jgi:hypothetical protein
LDCTYSIYISVLAGVKTISLFYLEEVFGMTDLKMKEIYSKMPKPIASG